VADDIAKHRAEIDALDAKIVELLNARAAHAAAIGTLKASGGAYRPEREAEVLRRVAGANRGPLSNAVLLRLYTEIISACRSLEEPLTVAYLGPQGTFSEMALGKQFGASVEALPCASIDEVFRAAETGAAGYAVVPVENSTDGAIGRTLDLLLSTPLRICAEVVLRVQQNLMAKRPSMKSIRKVYSHPQSLAQCQGWLAQHLPRAERVPAASNAEGARIAAKEGNAAAIGPEIAAGRYGLKILARSIEDVALYRDVLLGAEPAPLPEVAAPARIGFCRPYFWDRIEATTGKLLEDGARRLARAGAKVEEVELPAADYEGLEAAHRWISGFEMARNLAWEIENHWDKISEKFRDGRLKDGLGCSYERYCEMRDRVARCRHLLAPVMARYDALLAPAAAGEAPAGMHPIPHPYVYMIWTAMHVPSITLPVFEGPNGLPIGAQLVAKSCDDRRLFAVARWAYRILRDS